MARGESPYQGRYTVPIHDYSPIERGGAAWGQAFQNVGASIGAGIEKYGLKKEENKVLKGQLAAAKKRRIGIEGQIESGFFSDDPKINAALLKTIREMIPDPATDSDKSLRQQATEAKADVETMEWYIERWQAKEKMERQYPESPMTLFGRSLSGHGGGGGGTPPPNAGLIDNLTPPPAPAPVSPQVPVRQPTQGPQHSRPDTPDVPSPLPSNVFSPPPDVPPAPGDDMRAIFSDGQEGPGGTKGTPGGWAPMTMEEWHTQGIGAKGKWNVDEGTGLPAQEALTANEERIWEHYQTGIYGEKEGDALDTLMDNIRAKQKRIDEHPQKLAEYRKLQLANMAALRNYNADAPMDMKGVKELIKANNAWAKKEGMKIPKYHIDGTKGNLTVSFDVAEDMPPLRVTHFEDPEDSTKTIKLAGIFNDGGAKPTFYHIQDGKLSKPFFNAWEAAADKLTILNAKKGVIWKKMVGRNLITTDDRLMDVDFSEFYRTMVLVEKAQKKKVDVTRFTDHTKLKANEKGNLSDVGWAIDTNGMLEIQTKNPMAKTKEDVFLNFKYDTNAAWFKDAMKDFEEYEKILAQVKALHDEGMTATGAPGPRGARGELGETGVPPPARAPTPQYPPRSYDKTDILNQIKR